MECPAQVSLGAGLRPVPFPVVSDLRGTVSYRSLGPALESKMSKENPREAWLMPLTRWVSRFLTAMIQLLPPFYPLNLPWPAL